MLLKQVSGNSAVKLEGTVKLFTKASFNLQFSPSRVLKLVSVILQSYVENVDTACRK